jgi:hypothetical protein
VATKNAKADASRAIRAPSRPAPPDIVALRVKFMALKKFRISVIFDKRRGKVPAMVPFQPRRTIGYAFAPHNRRPW